MAKPTKRRGKKGRGGGSSSSGQAAAPESSAAGSTAPNSATDSTVSNVSVSLRAKLEFHEATMGMDSCLAEDPDAPSGDSINYKLTQWSRKKSVLNWFNAGCAKDPTAELWVDVASKDARKALHLMVSKDFKELKSLSRGLDGQRRLLVLHSSNTKWDLGPLSAEDEKKARVLLATLRDQQGSDQQGSKWSVDEAKEMVALNSMPEETERLLAKAMADQKALEDLLEGIKSSDVPAVRVALAAAPHLLSEKVKHYASGDAPLHVASAGGSTTIIKLLMEAGADVHQRDGKGRTALKVALAAEQCDAEGMLIQSGAFDPDADKDLQTELDVGPQQSSTDVEEAADGTAAVATGAAVPSTPPQEAVEPGGLPGAAGQQPPAAAVAANGASKAADAGKGAQPKGDKAKVATGAVPAELAGAMKSAAQAARSAADSVGGAAQPATSINGAAATNGATPANGASGAGPSGTAVAPRAAAPVSISEIQPASPRGAAGGAAEPHRMTPDDCDVEQENGLEVLLDWMQGGATSVVEWCKGHQGVVGAVALAAAVGVGIVTTLSKRR